MQNWIHVKRYLSTLVRLPSPASQSCSNDARGTSCAEQRRYTTRRRSRCRPPEDLPDSEGACSTSSRCEHKRVTDPSLGLPGVFKDRLHGIHPIEMHRQVLPVPCASSKVVQVPCPVPGAREQALLIIFIDVALVHVIEKGTLQWKQGLTCSALTQDMAPCLQAW